jgi:hypothetical protein
MTHIPDNPGKPSLLQLMKCAVETYQTLGARQPEESIPAAETKKANVLKHVDNPAGGSAPPLTIWKRVPEQEAPMNFSDLIVSADRLIKAGDFEAANDCLEKANRMVSKASNIHIHNHPDLGDDEDDDEPDDDEDGFDSPSKTSLEKASEHHSLPHYGGTSLPEQPSSTVRGPDPTADPYHLDTTAPESGPLKTRFDALVDKIVQRDGVSRMIAQQRARVENPSAYTDYQDLSSELPTSRQHMRRPVGQTTKRYYDEGSSYEDLLARELKKGVNMEVGAQRVLQQFGSAALHSKMYKTENLSDRFARIVKRISESEGLPMEMATREARLRNPNLVKAMNSV